MNRASFSGHQIFPSSICPHGTWVKSIIDKFYFPEPSATSSRRVQAQPAIAGEVRAFRHVVYRVKEDPTKAEAMLAEWGI